VKIVVDASVAVGWYLDEDYAAEALALYRSRPEIHVPDFFYQEVANVFWKRARRREIQPSDVDDWLDHLLAVSMTTHQSRTLVRTAWNLAIGIGITVYDAAYLAVARSENCAVVTADRPLFRDAGAAGYHDHVRWIDDPKLLSAS
jgi:predicted nucleic acid-binding protein